MNAMRYRRPAEAVHIVGQGWGFEWYKAEIDRVILLYNRGCPLPAIARELGRSARDTFLLLLELVEQGRIRQRPGKIWGSGG